MSELQISLLLIGIVVVVAIYVYNSWQQRQYRRQFGKTFPARHEDVLVRSAQQEVTTESPPTPWQAESVETVLPDEPAVLPEEPVKLAAVALANKNARIIWALLANGESYNSAKAA